MIDLFYFSGLPVAVLGLGTSGLSAARALAASKADVRAWDDDPARRAAAEREGIPVVDLAACDWREMTTLVISPGIPHLHPAPHPVAALAREHNCEIVSDIELLARAQRNASYVGITGTNGKSTTTALIGHILETAGRDVAVGGNLGTPALALEALESGGIYVLEMSSYQLEITVSITFDVAVLLNISADHLERHGGFEGYVAAKRLIFHRQTRPRSAIVGIDDETSRGIWEDLSTADEQIVVPISGSRAAPGGVYVDEGVLVDDTEGQGVRALDLRPIPSLPGAHNWQNAAAAYAACKALGIQPPVITACMQSFPGLAHRQELVAVIDGVSYVNDSKATNADAAAKALACYGRIFWIAGGQPKEGGLAALAPTYGNIAHAFLIGEAAESFAEALDGQVAHSLCGDLETAVRAAQAAANQAGKTGAVVLLSPAAASFDQYRNFEARGEHFRALVEALPGHHADLGPGGAVLP
ncbi:MAG: UDP-N-acetylmuramoyl-L-alanine--D-glutamate ligase [Kiloniellales bacterium]|nr:UDP-N-acetylmuramoyl-L-alanine--D-glutamate ligase [Kiloniellales bacterium]